VGGQEALHDVGDGVRAWRQPDGSRGLSDAGPSADGDASLLVDTLYDLPRTRRMLAAMADAPPAAGAIDTRVNTLGNGDHGCGNPRVGGARIGSTAASP